jgi:diaminohydroxyphosphoribosylaminopyrimidine deaminase / 5-amino-6-(5-phosphoribosylamino)uracil reductase
MIDHNLYLDRCVVLARLANKKTKTNPMVGAVIVHNDKIIGEGYHEYYGGPHAEVNAVRSVKEDDRYLLSEATIYVSLEPCNIYGKTPPCVNLINENNIKKVVIGALDPNPYMNGKSVELLRNNGCEVVVVDHQESRNLINKFKKNLSKDCYITLKWAQSADHFMGIEGDRVKITEEATDIMMHKLRSEVDGIMVGKITALIDNPSLTTRLYSGENPTRILIDDRLEVPSTHHIFDTNANTIIFNQQINEVRNNIRYIIYDKCIPHDLIHKLHDCGIYHCIVEGGAKLLNYFIQNNLWDEAIIITNKRSLTNPNNRKGILSPLLHGRLNKQISIAEDSIDYVYRNND